MPMQTKCGLHFDKILLKPLFTEEKKKKKEINSPFTRDLEIFLNVLVKMLQFLS